MNCTLQYLMGLCRSCVQERCFGMFAGIDCEEARNEEERMMLKDAREWLAAGEVREELHTKTRASALHVAAAKGYIKVME